MSDVKYLKITATQDGYGDEYDGTSLTIDQVTPEQILAELNDYSLQQMGFLRLSAAKGKKIDEKAAAVLTQHGWVHAASVKDAVERKKLEEKFFLLDRSYYSKPVEVNPKSLTDYHTQRISEGAEIVQVVDPKSVMPPSQWKKIEEKRQKKIQAAEKRKLAAAEKQKKAQQKKIDAAKKLLQAAGELPTT